MGLIRAARGLERFDFTLADYEYQFDAIDRAQENGGMITIEDVLIQKIHAWRPQDRDDLDAIIATKPLFDRAYVERWCAMFETTDRLQKVTAALDEPLRERSAGEGDFGVER